MLVFSIQMRVRSSSLPTNQPHSWHFPAATPSLLCCILFRLLYFHYAFVVLPIVSLLCSCRLLINSSFLLAEPSLLCCRLAEHYSSLLNLTYLLLVHSLAISLPPSLRPRLLIIPLVALFSAVIFLFSSLLVLFAPVCYSFHPSLASRIFMCLS